MSRYHVNATLSRIKASSGELRRSFFPRPSFRRARDRRPVMSPLRMPEGDLLRGYVESTLDDDDGFLPFDAAYLDIRRHAVLAVSGRADMAPPQARG